MSQNRSTQSSKTIWLKKLRSFHKWPGIILAVSLILFSLSGIVLNHRNWFSEIDVSRNLLPDGYKFTNWNLAALKGSKKITLNDYVVYGNVGAWLTNDSLNRFTDLNKGFSKGVDNRKIEAMLFTSKGKLLAGTLFGLYRYNGKMWIKLNLPQPNVRITDIIEANGQILILTRSHLITTTNLQHFTTNTLPASKDYDNKVSLFRTLWTLHSGELFGHWGKIVVDILGLGLIFLSITGILHWLFPKWIKHQKKQNITVEKLRKTMILNLNLHNKAGYILAGFLVISAVTGIFLRPPLLITIANTKVKKVPFSVMDNPNPWNDKLRRIIHIEAHDSYLISTSDGFFVFDNTLTIPAQTIQPQPPVSIMGCAVLEAHSKKDNTLLIGSFSGFFEWNLEYGIILNAINNQPYLESNRSGSPVSANMISGYIKTSLGEHLIDYNKGIGTFKGAQPSPMMPKGIIESTPMSLWNLALEIHTGRIFENLLGLFYFLYVPLIGLTLLLVLISGFFIWWLAYKKLKPLINKQLKA